MGHDHHGVVRLEVRVPVRLEVRMPVLFKMRQEAAARTLQVELRGATAITILGRRRAADSR